MKIRARISDLADLKERVVYLFGQADLKVEVFHTHQVTFFIKGAPITLQADLASKTNSSSWSVIDGVIWTYIDDEENLLLSFSKASRGLVLVTAAIKSLMAEYMAEVLAARSR
jgi:hypothetical protein